MTKEDMEVIITTIITGTVKATYSGKIKVAFEESKFEDYPFNTYQHLQHLMHILMNNLHDKCRCAPLLACNINQAVDTVLGLADNCPEHARVAFRFAVLQRWQEIISAPNAIPPKPQRGYSHTPRNIRLKVASV
jgi:hypothetical protein